MTDGRSFRIGVLGSGKGSNFVAIAEAIRAGAMPAEVAIVLSDVESAGILERARERGLPARYVAPGKFRTKLDDEAEANFVTALREAKVDLVVLAGFMRILKSGLMNAFLNRIINIHPSLLPSFPGLEAWKQALSADRPVVLEVKTDPESAPLPPHISLKEAKKFMFAMTKDEDAGHVIRDTARQVINAVLHKEDAG